MASHSPKHHGHPVAPVRSLPSGKYFIRVKESGLFVSALEAEALHPRKVATLPHGTKPPKWTIQQIDERRYYLKIDNDPAANIDGKVWALELWQPEPSHEMWILEHRPMQGDDVFTISSAQGALSWVMESSAPHTQVSLKELGVFIPEQPPKNALFVLSRVH
ncbi:hypothetical protein BDW22DRAFT_1359112 [Trametopsis cervina]|nr:hypothetical protein BDW22DRAFT_1359112 [Trametopsis cervina]